MRAQALFLAATLSSLTLAAPARAQVDPREEATKLYQHGRDANARGAYAEAQRLFEEAYALDPDPGLLISIANMRMKQGDFRGAADRYEQIVQTLSVPAPIRAQAQRKLDALRPLLNEPWLRFQGVGPGPRVAGERRLQVSDERVPAPEGRTLVAWADGAGALFVTELLLARGVETLVRPFEVQHAARLVLDPPLGEGESLRFGGEPLVVPAAVATLWLDRDFSGELRLLDAKGHLLATRTADLGRGTELRWVWAAPRRGGAKKFPWVWVAVGGGAAVVAGVVTAVLLASGGGGTKNPNSDMKLSF